MSPTPLSILALALSLALVAPCPTRASTVGDVLDQTLAALLQQTDTPGASATITRNGQTLWSGASGFADPAAQVPFTPRTLSSIASVTKLVTSTIVTRLAEKGLLSLDAPIAPYLPAGLPGTDRVTIRHLVEMTAGYADVEGLPDIEEAFRDPNHPWTRDELLSRITAPQFEPGTQSDYSNTNYLLLGAIIDDVYPGGTSAAFQDLIAGPAALGEDMVFDRDPAAAHRVADGYATRGGVTVNVNAGATDLGVNTSVWGPLWTDGGIVATSGGVARFSDALYGGLLLNAGNTEAAKVCGFTFSGRCFDGFIGAFNGYSAFVMHDSTRKVTVSAVLNGLDEDTGSQFLFIPGLIDAYIASAEPPAPSPVPLPATAPLLALGLAGLIGFCRARRVRTA